MKTGRAESRRQAGTRQTHRPTDKTGSDNRLQGGTQPDRPPSSIGGAPDQTQRPPCQPQPTETAREAGRGRPPAEGRVQTGRGRTDRQRPERQRARQAEAGQAEGGQAEARQAEAKTELQYATAC